MKRKFKIDFYEFSFLVEACIPPRPIARAMFWDDVCDVYYHQMNKDERERLFEWIPRDSNFNLRNNNCARFYARFNPKRQYLVTTEIFKGIEHEGKKEEHETYKFYDKYYTSKNKYINEENIIKIKQMLI